MDNNLKEKIGIKLLAQHPNLVAVWVCDDGTAFDRETLAKEYAQKLGKAEMVKVEKPVEQQVEAVEQVEKQVEPTEKKPKKGTKKAAKKE